MKDSKKKAKMASAKGNTSRDWGKGFACAGRQKVCTIVPQNHFGPIPGVEVGTLWKFRLQVRRWSVVFVLSVLYLLLRLHFLIGFSHHFLLSVLQLIISPTLSLKCIFVHLLLVLLVPIIFRRVSLWECL